MDTCKDCEYARRDAHSRKAYLHSHEVPVAAFERVHMDHLQLVKSGQYSYLLVLCDALTQYVELYPCVGCSAKEACEKLIGYISRLGCMRFLMSDRGPAFVGKVMTALTQLLGIKQLKTSSYHAQSNGRVEFCNSMILKMLRVYCTDQTDW